MSVTNSNPASISVTASSSYEDVNKAIVIWEENMLTYEISVNGDTYDLDDFDYIGTGTFIFYDPVMTDPYTIVEYRAFHAVWDIIYDFGDGDGGLDGQLMMRALLSSSEGMRIFNKQSTGDFQNVKIQATQGEGPDIGPGFPIVTIYHVGRVSGWPAPP